MDDKVLISAEELERLKACELSLYFLHRKIKLCPVCRKGMLCDEFICPNCCGFNNSIEIEE